MAVFGEETVELNIFNGVSASIFHKKQDLCSEIINLIKSGPSEYTIREDFLLIQQITQAHTPLDTNYIPKPMSLVQNDIEIFVAIASKTVDSPSLLACKAADVTWLNSNAVTPINVVQTISKPIKAFCQVRDRYYASNGTTHIFGVSNFSGIPATPLTVTDLVAVGVDLLIPFKNRVFGIKNGRIYWTDLPAIGLYPETWNLVVNFTDMPSVDFDITIHNALVYKDKMYLFTDRGVYYLMANGDPLNWSIQLVSSNYPIFNRDSVCINRNIVFLTDQSALYAFDGSKFTKVSESIKELFYNSKSAFQVLKVYPYEDGVILYRIEMEKDITTGTYIYSPDQNRLLYYFDLDIWVTLRLDFADNQVEHVVKIGTYLQPYRSLEPSSFIYYTNSLVANSLRCMHLQSGHWEGDVYSYIHNLGRSPKSFSIKGPYPFLESRNFVKYKRFILYAMINSSDAPIWLSPTKQLITMSPRNAIFNIPTTVEQGEFNYRDYAFNFYGNVGMDDTTPEYTPPLIITKVEAIVNTDNRSADQLRNS